MNDNLSPFHEQAQEFGEYVIEDRAADADRRRPIERPSGLSANAD
jgi:hypothetical protein